MSYIKKGRKKDYVLKVVFEATVPAYTEMQNKQVIEKGTIVFIRDRKANVEGFGFVVGEEFLNAYELDSKYYEVVEMEKPDGRKADLDNSDIIGVLKHSLCVTDRTSKWHHSKVFAVAKVKPERKKVFGLLTL